MFLEFVKREKWCKNKEINWLKIQFVEMYFWKKEEEKSEEKICVIFCFNYFYFWLFLFLVFGDVNNIVSVEFICNCFGVKKCY